MLHTICAWIRTISGFLACFTIFVLTVLVFAGRLEAMWFHCVICDMWYCPILSVCVMSLVWKKTACRANIARSSRTGMKRHWICCWHNYNVTISINIARSSWTGKKRHWTADTIIINSIKIARSSWTGKKRNWTADTIIINSIKLARSSWTGKKRHWTVDTIIMLLAA